jgi:hypothetical protein
MTRPYKYDRPYTTWLTTKCVICRGFAVKKAGERSNGSICATCRKKDFPNGNTTSLEDNTTTLTVTTESSEH